jgi:hypothetical protein
LKELGVTPVQTRPSNWLGKASEMIKAAFTAL